jgi:ribosome-binding factor A
LASRLKFLVSHVIQTELQDPRLGFVTVLGVTPTEDLKEAKVYVSVLGSPQDRRRTLRALDEACGFIQRQVGKSLRVRQTPALSFVFDDRQDKVARIESLLDGIRRGKASQPIEQPIEGHDDLEPEEANEPEEG